MIGPAPWRQAAPAAFDAFDAVEAAAAVAVEPALLDPVRRSVAAILGDPAGPDPSPAEITPAPPDARIGVCVHFAEQFVVDVGGIRDQDRAALAEALGPGVFTFVQTLFVVDVFGRARLALSRLHHLGFGPSPPPRLADLWAALEGFMRTVARLDGLDPVTTELVRLRGATVHDCRLCRSRLSVRAVDAARGPELFDVVGDYERSSLGRRHKVALRLTDAVLTQPSLIDERLVSQVDEELTVGESTEIVLDVVRNAANKIAVALGADAPHVAGGTEFFDTDAAGDVVADVDPEVVRRAVAR
ncbi:MAG: carboxymuconolactone decarboxylase family protein [Acidimicrobiales bacterium]